ncbi:MAG: DUF4105 domain-containing protein [Bacteroidales bacterium]
MTGKSKKNLANKKSLVTLVFLLLFSISAYSETPRLSDKAEISLMTCSPGTEIYAVFGHTAIRVLDRENNIDYTYNYGVFSMGWDNFYWKFSLGETYYMLQKEPTARFVRVYNYYNRGIKAAVLNLSMTEKQRLFDALENEALPENRTYLYNYFFNNCSTKAKDVIFSVERSAIEYKGDIPQKSFRDYINEYTANNPMYQYILSLPLGAETDRTTSREESMFLPDCLDKELQNACYSSDKLPIFVDTYTILPSPKVEEISFFSAFNLVFIGICLLIVLVSIFSKRLLLFVDYTLLLIFTIGGLILAFLALFSLHPCVKTNLNILWLNPLCIVLIIQLIRSKKAILTRRLFKIYAVLIVLFLILTAFGMQYVHYLTVILLISYLIRIFFVLRKSDYSAAERNKL